MFRRRRRNEAFDAWSNGKSIHRYDRVHREMWGRWSDQALSRFMDHVTNIAGDFAEIGVAEGRTFHRLVRYARDSARTVHGFDSFRGMAPPGVHDRQQGEVGAHQEGKFDVGGSQAFAFMLHKRHGIAPDSGYRLWEGYIPDCFTAFDDAETSAQRFAFAIIDVDHYAPTAQALAWTWPRVTMGGVLALDDFAPEWGNIESSRAISEFLRSADDFELLDYFNNQIFLRKVARS